MVGSICYFKLGHLKLLFNQAIDDQSCHHIETSQLICSANQQIAGLVILDILSENIYDKVHI